jgi:uncharacterized protein YbjT (DUF2867 family)
MAGDGPVVVIGGTGMLGGQVVTSLLSRGRQVRALVRPSSDPERLRQAGVAAARNGWCRCRGQHGGRLYPA